jgi:hypothetical protein
LKKEDDGVFTIGKDAHCEYGFEMNLRVSVLPENKDEMSKYASRNGFKILGIDNVFDEYDKKRPLVGNIFILQKHLSN